MPTEEYSKLATALRAIDTLTIPQVLSDHNIEYDGPGYFDRHMCEIPQIYGFNTLPGHRVDESVPAEDMVKFQYNLVSNHRLGSGPYMDDKTARAITYAKLYAAASGNTLITKQLYAELLKAAVDPHFKPKIPMHASYSAGDVIPAAHWAQDLINWDKKQSQKDILQDGGCMLQAGEGMALINGAFVHVGATVSMIRDLYNFWGLYTDTAEKSFELLGADARVFDEPSTADNAWFRATMQHAKKALECEARASKVQDPISIRTYPQQIQAATFAISNLLRETENVLDKPSGNPVMYKKKNGTVVVSPSGSFDQASLALATSGVIEALLMLGWNSARRTTHMLNGKIADLPKDGATDNDQLAMIQWPKLAQAELERVRGKYGMRNFTSGSSTSEEIEDFWTNGTELCLSAKDLIKDVEKILMIERLTAERMEMVVNKDPRASSITLSSINDKFIDKVKSQIDYADIAFPFKLGQGAQRPPVPGQSIDGTAKKIPQQQPRVARLAK